MRYICEYYKNCEYERCCWNYRIPQQLYKLFIDITSYVFSCCETEHSLTRKRIKLVPITKLQWLIYKKGYAHVNNL